MDKAGVIREWALARIGCGYVYGGTGVICTESYRRARAAQYPALANKILGVAARWDGKPVYDCAQFTRRAAEAAGIMLPSGASSQWRGNHWADRGAIGCLPEGRVCFLYHESKSARPMGHTGVYLGDGTAADARGHAEGVIRTPVADYPWTHWAVPRGLYAEDGAEAQPVLALGSTGPEVKRLQELLIARGYALPLHGADGSFGRETESAVIACQLDHGLPPRGTVGQATWASIDKRAPGLEQRLDSLEARVAALEARTA